MTTYIIDGKEVPAESGLDIARNPRLTFKVGTHSVSKRKNKPDLLVIHWTGGEGSAAGCFSTLKGRTSAKAPRGLSVQFYMDFDGVVTQYCDASLVAQHSGYVNKRAIGIEVQNPGYPPKKGTKANPKFPRGYYLTKIHGRAVSCVMFNGEQVESIIDWINDMCDIYGIPKKLPRVKGEVPIFKMTPKQVAAHSGVIFHYMISDEKYDPGTQLIDVLLDEGF